MSNFECPVVRVTIEPHPNADAIEVAVVGGYRSIVKKGQFQTGDLAVYLPEQSVLPEWMLKNLGFWDDLNGKGTLSSSAGNRIRAIKLRGVLSQGILLGNCASINKAINIVLEAPTEDGLDFQLEAFRESENVAEFLGVTKYEPAIPLHLAGKVAGGDLDATFGYDFENLKKFPDLFDDGMDVVITEKIHGTLLQVGLIPKSIWEGKSWADKCPTLEGTELKCIVTSKGQGARGLMLDPSDMTNLYVSIATKLDLWDRLAEVFSSHCITTETPAFLFGEVFGQGVQDLGYGTPEKSFRAFDIYFGTRNNGTFMPFAEFIGACAATGIPVVPVLWQGEYNADIVQRLTDGNTTLTKDKHIREGVVVKSAHEARHPRYGRRIAKSVSAAYLLRKGEVSEFQ